MLPNKRGIFYAQVTFFPFSQIFFHQIPPPHSGPQNHFKVDNVYRQDTKIGSCKINCFTTSILNCLNLTFFVILS